ncbi:MAG: DUF4124 domain-containing protein [Burkholderiales bacterium]|nr:MAG: DUF4124 domain-containing protein [Burkholderiales bacterium]
MPLRHLLPLLLLAITVAPHAHAQYKWRDADGRIVYSDLPPPTSISPDAVLKGPGLRAPSERAGASPTAGASPGAAPSAPAATSAADRELEFRKRRLERAEAERKAAGDAAKAKQLAAACEETRNELRTLESGMRMSRVNERGEREFIDDTQRAQRLESARKTAREHCASS